MLTGILLAEPGGLAVKVRDGPVTLSGILARKSSSHSEPGRGPPFQCSALPVARDDDDRAMCMLGDLAAHRPEHQPGEATHAAGSDDQKIGVT